MMAAHFKGALDRCERSRSFPRGPRLCSERGVAAGIGVSMDDRKWIAIMVASMLLLVGVAALLVQQPELVVTGHSVVSGRPFAF
jgi:hypothetical protein